MDELTVLGSGGFLVLGFVNGLPDLSSSLDSADMTTSMRHSKSIKMDFIIFIIKFLSLTLDLPLSCLQ